MTEQTIVEIIKEAISKTNMANVASFLLVVSMMGFAIKTGDKEIVLIAGGAGIGYLFGANKNT